MTLKLLGGDTAALSIPANNEDDRVRLTDGNILLVNKHLGSSTSGGGNIKTIDINVQCSYDGFIVSVRFLYMVFVRLLGFPRLSVIFVLSLQLFYISKVLAYKTSH